MHPCPIKQSGAKTIVERLVAQTGSLNDVDLAETAQALPMAIERGGEKTRIRVDVILEQRLTQILPHVRFNLPIQIFDSDFNLHPCHAALRRKDSSDPQTSLAPG
jgi:hypothetical protein